MARIADHHLAQIFYLYPSERDAEYSTNAGGTGFIAAIPPTVGKSNYIFGVTNRHVVEKFQSKVLRFNDGVGGVRIVKLPDERIMWHDDVDDVVIFGIAGLPAIKVLKGLSAVSTESFATPEIIRQGKIGVGDDVFMVGRMTDLSGRMRNTPVVRHGNIARMPFDEEMRDADGHLVESYAVEMRSHGGFSGSPVFVTYLLDDPFRAKDEMEKLGGLPTGMRKTYLLGVCRGHLGNRARLLDENGEKVQLTVDDRQYEGLHINTNMNMAAVVPCWKILEILSKVGSDD